MKVVILAGGYGNRLSEETQTKPKPMVEIGGKPILWHIMKIYSHFGYNEFIICLGYKGFMIKEYFSNYFLHQSDVTIDLAKNDVKIHSSVSEPWKVTLVDTGEATMTGGRILRIKPFVDRERFMMTYGDGVADIDIRALAELHAKKKTLATITAAQPGGRFGVLTIDSSQRVTHFHEKPAGDGSWVNAGFFVLEPAIFDYLHDDATIFERTPLEQVAKDHQLGAYRHDGFWMPMDKLSDKIHLESLWNTHSAPWKVWA